MTAAERPMVTVVGAGPTGLTAACLLLRYGVACRVVDAAERATSASRAIGVSSRSLEVLDEIGAALDLVGLGLPSHVANFYARDRLIARLSSTRLQDTEFPFLLAVPQSSTERVLEERLRTLGGKVERGVQVAGVEQGSDGVELNETYDGARRTTTADWVIGADGSHSVVRKALSVGFDGAATGRVFANVDAVLDPAPRAGEGHYHFTPEGMLVMAPLPGGVHRITASLEGTPGARPLGPDDVQALVDRRAGGSGRVRQLADAGWGVATVAVQARIASRFFVGRCVLAGDAAHVFGPTGAQGMNAGIQDAHAAAWRIAHVAAGLADPELLDGYDAERRTQAHRVLRAVEKQTRLGTVRHPVARTLRDGALRAASRAGLLDRRLAPRISQLDVDYGEGDCVVALDGGSGAGCRIPDTELGPDGISLHRRLRAVPWNLVVLGADHGDLARVRAVVDAEAPAGVGIGVHAVSRRERTSWSGAPADGDGTLARFLGGRGARIALVRPDGYVAATGRADQVGAVVAHLRRTLRAARPA
jgi:2-polyprenyl-6-methoxyphenol hydroxylase-like FAD-dependent oxidoreductase